MDLKQFCKDCHNMAVEKGFWECPECKGEGSVIIESHHCDCPKCDGTGKEERNISELLMLCVSELGEACEALRKGKIQVKGSSWDKDTFEDEITDVFIRLGDLSEALTHFRTTDFKEFEDVVKLYANKVNEPKNLMEDFFIKTALYSCS